MLRTCGKSLLFVALFLEKLNTVRRKSEKSSFFDSSIPYGAKTKRVQETAYNPKAFFCDALVPKRELFHVHTSQV